MRNIFENPVELIFKSNKVEKKKAIIQPFTSVLRFGFDSISFGELKNKALEYSIYLKKKYDIGKGTKLLLMVPFSIEMYICVIAIFLLGGCVVLIEPWIGRNLFKKVLGSVNTKFVISGSRTKILLKLFRYVEKDKIFIKIPKRDRACPTTGEKFVQVTENDTAVITFSTGSSGTPKPIRRSYGDLMYQMKRLSEHIKEEESIDFISFPNLVLYNLSRYNTTIIPERSFKGSTPISDEILRTCIAREKLSRLFVSVSHLTTINDKDIYERINSIYTGGSIIKASFIKEYDLAEKIYILYGTTEVEPIATINGVDFLSIKERGIPVGQIDDSLEMKIDPIEKNIGEVLIKRKYETISTDQWLRTGDIGYLNKDNVLILLGRKIDIFFFNGRYIYPYEIQNIMDREGIPGKIIPYVKNDTLLIIVEGKENEIMSRKVIKTLEKIKISPDKIIFLKEIPRDPRHRAKIDMKKLYRYINNYF